VTTLIPYAYLVSDIALFESVEWETRVAL